MKKTILDIKLQFCHQDESGDFSMNINIQKTIVNFNNTGAH